MNQDKKKIFPIWANQISLNKQVSILKTLTYFGQFNYPLTREELVIFLDQKISSVELTDNLHHLKKSGLIFQAGHFYSLKDDPALFETRVKGNLRALALLTQAENKSRLLYNFPFTRAVFISGSLSKNFAGEDADIDYFIITKSGRLWIARTLMHILKKISFLFGKQHLFCMNYYIDEENLKIIEQNSYTATEIFTLLPFCGDNSINEFFRINNWVNLYYPNYELKNLQPRTSVRSSFIKKFFELCLDNGFGNKIDDYLMKFTANRWKSKESANPITKKGRKMGIRVSKHFCKPNPDYYQEKMLKSYFRQLKAILIKFSQLCEEQKSTFLN